MVHSGSSILENSGGVLHLVQSKYCALEDVLVLRASAGGVCRWHLVHPGKRRLPQCGPLPVQFSGCDATICASRERARCFNFKDVPHQDLARESAQPAQYPAAANNCHHHRRQIIRRGVSQDWPTAGDGRDGGRHRPGPVRAGTALAAGNGVALSARFDGHVKSVKSDRRGAFHVRRRDGIGSGAFARESGGRDHGQPCQHHRPLSAGHGAGTTHLHAVGARRHLFHGFRSLHGNCDEHHRVSGARANIGGPRAGPDQFGQYGNRVCCSRRCYCLVHPGVRDSAVIVLLVLLFIGVMLLVVKPRLARLFQERVDRPSYSKGLVAGVLALVLACAWFTESIGIHALFGAFLAGVVMPSASGVRLFLKEKLEAFSSAALLPLFFAFTGLRTEIRLLNDWSGWLMCGGIIVVAVAGNLGGSMLMARWTKMSWRDSFSIGVLMNTRGLIELVVLNIGYDLGILSGRIFVMMVIMALATTFMTAPLLSILKLKRQA